MTHVKLNLEHFEHLFTNFHQKILYVPNFLVHCVCPHCSAALTCTSMDGWFIYGSQFVTLSGDQNEVFQYLILQSLLLTAYLRKSHRHFFSFSIFDFYGLIIVNAKAFSLWRRQKYNQRRTLKISIRYLFIIMPSTNTSKSIHSCQYDFGKDYLNDAKHLEKVSRKLVRYRNHGRGKFVGKKWSIIV